MNGPGVLIDEHKTVPKRPSPWSKVTFDHGGWSNPCPPIGVELVPANSTQNQLCQVIRRGICISLHLQFNCVDYAKGVFSQFCQVFCMVPIMGDHNTQGNGAGFPVPISQLLLANFGSSNAALDRWPLTC